MRTASRYRGYLCRHDFLNVSRQQSCGGAFVFKPRMSRATSDILAVCLLRLGCNGCCLGELMDMALLRGRRSGV